MTPRPNFLRGSSCARPRPRPDHPGPAHDRSGWTAAARHATIAGDAASPSLSPDTTPRVRRDSLLSIEALRWISAELVALLHADHEWLKLAGRSGEIYRMRPVFEPGIGVDIFFFISGFLMFHVSRGDFAVPGMPWDFFRRRLLRIVPLYWLATAGMLAAIFAIPAQLNQHALSLVHTAMSFLLIAWPDPTGQLFPVLNSGWTLNLEMYFYALFAVALFCRQWIGVALVMGWLGATVALAQTLPAPPWWLDFYGQPIALEFAAGLCLSLLYARGLRLAVPVSALIGGAALLLHMGLRARWPDIPRLPGNGVPAGLIFFAVVFCRPVALPVAAQAVLRVLGRSSYAVYLTSPFAISATALVAWRLGLHGLIVLLGLCALACTVVAIFVAEVIERPIGRIGRRVLF